MLGPSPGLNLRHLRKSQGQTEVENLGHHGWPNKGILPSGDLGVTNSAAINLSLCWALEANHGFIQSLQRSKRPVTWDTHAPDNLTSQTAS